MNNDDTEKTNIIRVHDEWAKVMRRNKSADTTDASLNFFGPSSLVSGNTDLCCDLLENICKQPRSIDASRVTAGEEYPPDIPVFTAEHETSLLQEQHSIILPNGTKVQTRPCVCGSKCVGLEP